MSKQKDKAEFSAKIKLLKIYELLRKETDENHPMSRTELCRRLNEERISSNVRTLSKDIEVLNLYGYEVQSFIKNHERFYYIPEFEFSVPEVKILMDAVQAASFITESKTKDLVDKIANLAGSSRGALLKKNMVCFNTRKHKNEKILYNVDRLEDAISRNKKASIFF